MNTTWTKSTTIGSHEYIKNKNIEYILIDDENKEAIADETQAFEVMGGALLTGIMRFQTCPLYMICLNPNSNKRKKYIFENVGYFENKILNKVLINN